MGVRERENSKVNPTTNKIAKSLKKKTGAILPSFAKNIPNRKALPKKPEAR